MDTLIDFLNNLDKYSIATEADDITGDISNQTDDVMGTKNDDGSPSNDDGEISDNTDDILGTSNDSNSDNGSEDTDNSDNDTESESGDDQDNMDDDPMNEDTPSEDGEAGDQPEKNAEDDFSESRKKKIKKQFLHLYNVISDSIKLLSTYSSDIVDDNYIRTMSNVTDNLTQCRNIIYDLAVNDFQSMEYHELLKKYIAINRVYELSTKTIEKYFEEYDKNK